MGHWKRAGMGERMTLWYVEGGIGYKGVGGGKVMQWGWKNV